jgi:hypothetical protein
MNNFLRSKHFNQYTFCVCAKGFRDLSKAFHYPIHLMQLILAAGKGWEVTGAWWGGGGGPTIQIRENWQPPCSLSYTSRLKLLRCTVSVGIEVGGPRGDVLT